MTYQELKLFNKYLWNRGNKDLFTKAMKEFLPHTTQSYIDKNWEQFRNSPIQFIATYDEKFYNIVYSYMIEDNYKG